MTKSANTNKLERNKNRERKYAPGPLQKFFFGIGWSFWTRVKILLFLFLIVACITLIGVMFGLIFPENSNAVPPHRVH